MAYYQCKVTFDSGETNKQGKPMITKTAMLVEATGVTEAEARTVKFLTDNDEQAFEVKSASESKIFDVISTGASEAE